MYGTDVLLIFQPVGKRSQGLRVFTGFGVKFREVGSQVRRLVLVVKLAVSPSFAIFFLPLSNRIHDFNDDRCCSAPSSSFSSASKPPFGYVVLLNEEVRWDFRPFASFYRNGKYRMTRSYNRQKQIFATSFGFYFYILFFLFTLYSNTEIHAESVEATPLK